MHHPLRPPEHSQQPHLSDIQAVDQKEKEGRRWQATRQCMRCKLSYKSRLSEPLEHSPATQPRRVGQGSILTYMTSMQ